MQCGNDFVLFETMVYFKRTGGIHIGCYNGNASPCIGGIPEFELSISTGLRPTGQGRPFGTYKHLVEI